jgi:6-pyruvoyltetrahydropterin/6-carboxytetrahydropterin synthase
VTLRGPVDATTGMVVNLTDVGAALRLVVAQLDHKHLDLDVCYFRDNAIVSTAENIAVFFWRALKQFPKVAPLLASVKLDETLKNSCTFDGTNDLSQSQLESMKGLNLSE